jgi:aryl-alcohol dehydrogenase-like predicted oxidoreductase
MEKFGIPKIRHPVKVKLPSIENLCLGTVKLGIPNYGFNLRSIDVNVDKFLTEMQGLGIENIDTAPSYGNSEEIVGKHIITTGKPVFFSSKIDSLKTNETKTPEIMIRSVKQSVTKLNIDCLNICYLHQNDLSILSDPFVLEGMQLLKEMKLIKYTGASVYSLKECELCMKLGVFDYIQVPVSIFDVSFYDEFIKHNNTPVKFVARSMLLQGVVTNRNGIISKISESKEVIRYLDKLDMIARRNDLRTIDLALAFVYSLENISQYIIGTTSITNLQNAIECLEIKLSNYLLEPVYSMALKPRAWTNPRNWINQ